MKIEPYLTEIPWYVLIYILGFGVSFLLLTNWYGKDLKSIFPKLAVSLIWPIILILLLGNDPN